MNKVIILGNIANEIQSGTMQSGRVYTRFRVAVRRSYKTNGKYQSDFIPVVVYGPSASFVANKLTKGCKIMVEGTLSIRKYTGKDGKESWTTDVMANIVEAITYPIIDGNAEDDTDENMEAEYLGGESGTDGNQAAVGNNGYMDVTDDVDLPF